MSGYRDGRCSTPRWRLALAAGAAVVVLGAAPAASAGARDDGARSATASNASPARLSGAPARVWLPFSRRMSRRWVELQRRNGTFPDAILGPGLQSRYGDAMLGYALVQSGLRDRRRSYLNAGLRAITWAARRGAPRYHGDAPFENLAVAGAYTSMRRSAPGYRPFRRVRKRWERFMRSRVRVYIQRAGEPPQPQARGYWNKWLVESIAMLEFVRSGLSSKRRGAALAQQRDTYRRIVSVVNRIVPDMADRSSVANGGGQLGLVLSDPPENPLAYHALSLGLIARAVRLLGPAAGPRARETLLRMVEASWSLMAPDGDVAYVGRSQEQAWALTFTAYGAGVAAELTRDPQRAARAQGVAERAVDRLVSVHPLLPTGLAITPALGRGLPAARSGLDRYAHMVDYNGLTLLGLNWAISESRGRRAPAGPIGSDSPGALVVDTGRPAMATVRTPDLWFAVKRSRSSQLLQYDFGLVAMKRLVAGRWRDVLPLRPLGTVSDSAGPYLFVNGVASEPLGETLEARPDGSVIVDGGFADAAGNILRRTRFTFAPAAGGVRLSFAAERGDTYELSSFHRSAPAVTSSASSLNVSSSAETLHVTAPAGTPLQPGGSWKVDLVPGLASGMDVGLTRARATFSLESPATVSVTYGGG